MPTVIDELVVRLGLDTKEFKKGEKEVGEGLKHTRDAAGGFARDIETSGKRAANYLASIKTEVMGLLLVLAGGKGLKALAGDMVSNAASIGVLSDVTGVATGKIAGLEGAIMGAGGTAREARGIVKNLSMVLGDMKLGLRPQNSGILQAFGINQETAKDPIEMFLQIADAAKRMDKLTFMDLATRFGLSDETIALLMQGRKAVADQLREYERLYNLHKADTDAAREFNKTLTDLSLTLEGKLYPALTPVLSGFSTWIRTGDNATIAGYGVAAAFTAIGIAAVAAYGPVALLAAILGSVAIAYKDIKHLLGMSPAERKAFDERGAQLRAKAWQQLKSGDIGGFFGTMGEGFTERMRADFASNASGGTGWMARQRQSLGSFMSGGSGAPKTGRGPAVALEGNNPGGINDSPFARKQPGYVGANGRYAAFDTLEHGEQAQAALLASYIRNGYNTPAKIAARWAPTADGNDPSRYAQTIARQLGIGVNDQLSLEDVKRFGQAQGVAENSAYRPSGGAQSAATLVRNAASLPARAGRAASVNSNNRSTVNFSGDIVVNGADKKTAEQIGREVRESFNKQMVPTQADGAFN